MKRSELMRYLNAQGCELLKGRRTAFIVAKIPCKKRRFSIPRHNEISDILANKFGCKAN